MTGEIRIEYEPLGALLRAPRNPKLHDYDALGASIDRFGFIQPLTKDERTGFLVAGHGRLETLQRMKAAGDAPPKRVRAEGGEWLVPVVRGVAFKTDAEAEAYLVADNRLVEVGGWDEKSLAGIMADLAKLPEPNLESLGFSQLDFDALLQATAPTASGSSTSIEVEDDELEEGTDDITDFGKGRLRAPFPYFGGKYAVAPYVWQRLGQPKQYLEPFCGSAAMLLGAPEPAKLEVIGDANCYIANFWRCVRFAPDALWQWADYPVSHIDQMSRHRWLVEPVRAEELKAKLLADPDWPGDPKIAGWWVWGQCSWIGSGWCEGTGASSQKPQYDDSDRGLLSSGVAAGGTASEKPFLSSPGQGLQSPGLPSTKVPHQGDRGRGLQKPFVGHTGCGLQAEVAAGQEWLRTLSARLERVRVIHGSWDRCLHHHYGGDDTAVFFDPPYKGHEFLYADGTSLDGVVEWCRASAHLRIALCGHQGDYDLPGWSVTTWSRKRKTYNGGSTTASEAIWFSPACLPHTP